MATTREIQDILNSRADDALRVRIQNAFSYIRALGPEADDALRQFNATVFGIPNQDGYAVLSTIQDLLFAEMRSAVRQKVTDEFLLKVERLPAEELVAARTRVAGGGGAGGGVGPGSTSTPTPTTP